MRSVRLSCFAPTLPLPSGRLGPSATLAPFAPRHRWCLALSNDTASAVAAVTMRHTIIVPHVLVRRTGFLTARDWLHTFGLVRHSYKKVVHCVGVKSGTVMTSPASKAQTSSDTV